MARPRKTKPFEIRLNEKTKQYTWRTTAPNGNITGGGGETYFNYLDCLNGARVTRDILSVEIANIEAKIAKLTQSTEGEE